MRAFNQRKSIYSAIIDPRAGYDVKLLFPVLLLVGIGIVMVYSASSALAMKKFGSDTFFLKKQVLFSFIGIMVLIACRHIPLKLLHSLTYPFLLASLLFLVAIFIPGCGYSAGVATRWVRIGSFTFQPSELARMAMVVYLAYSMSKKQEKMGDFFIGFLPHVLILSIFTGLILLQPDFGSAVILCAMTTILLFVGGARTRHLIFSLLAASPFVYYFLVSAQYRMQRLIAFWDPWQYAADGGYQIIHSLMAFGTGGLLGSGIGKGYQKLFYLPEPHTDFIFSVVGEELGLLGVAMILGLYTLVVIKGMKIAMNAKDTFASFLAIGLTTAMGLQICVNMGVTMALLPTKGLTLPFLSYGGTSLLLNMASVGLLMNIEAAEAE